VFNFGLPMKAEDYTHRIGRTGRAGRDGLAITFAEMRDRRRIMDIEQYTRQQFKTATIPGLEPQQRFMDTRLPRGFGGRDGQPQGRRGAPRGRAPERTGFGGFGGNGGVGGPAGDGRRSAAPREGFSYERKGGFNDRFAGQRQDGARRDGFRQDGFRQEGFRQDGAAAPRGDFAPRKPAFAKPGFAKPAPARHDGAGRAFVPRDGAKKRPAKPVR
jgi:superfamily II DNA/RNA helicase